VGLRKNLDKPKSEWMAAGLEPVTVSIRTQGSSTELRPLGSFSIALSRTFQDKIRQMKHHMKLIEHDSLCLPPLSLHVLATYASGSERSQEDF
jgi:hypothetical protein